MYLFFDTETTGLPRRWDRPASDFLNWPRLVQIGWICYNDNEEKLFCAEYIIKPEEFIIPKRVEMIHGISQERAMEDGIDLKDALLEFSEAMKKSEYLIAHNIKFDEKIVEAEFLRNEMKHGMDEREKICLKLLGTNFCKIPGHAGYKWPSLPELHNKLFGSFVQEEHNALADAELCAKCFFQMRRVGVV